MKEVSYKTILFETWVFDIHVRLFLQVQPIAIIMYLLFISKFARSTNNGRTTYNLN